MCPFEWRAGRVSGYRLRFNLDGRPKGRAAPANLYADPKAEVWGVLYRIRRHDLVRLDTTEGVPGRRYRHLWIEAEHSEGNTVPNPRFYRTSQKALRRKQRQLCRCKKGSKRKRKAAHNVAKTHLKINRQRRDHHFKVAKAYAESYRSIAVEDLQILNMVKNHHLAKSILDASWGAFLDILSAKAASAGHEVIRVNPHFTTQKCHHCGEIVQKSLSVHTHICPYCGYVADRDVNAAKNILLHAGAQPSGTVSAGSPGELRSPRL